jgi:hypothetical protein
MVETAPPVGDNLDELENFYRPISVRQEGVPPEFRTEPSEFRTQPPAPRQSRITDPTVRAAIDQLPERVRPIAEAEYELLQRRGGDGTATATAQRDLTLARGEREAREAFASQQRAELERVRARRVELPDFVPTQENAMSLGTLFGLVGVAGTLMGGKGQQSAIGAMNAMSGMMAGWRQGRTDLYNRERQKYEQEMKRVQEQNAVLQRDFQDALNVMKTDLDAGLARAREAAARHGVQIAGAAAARQGAAGVQSFLQGLRSTMMQLEANNARLQGTFQRVADPNNPGRVLYLNTRTNDFLRDPQTNEPIEAAPTGRAAGQAGPSATETRQRRDIRGQLRYLSEFMPESEVENLGTREVPAVTTRMESAELSSRLAEEVRRNPQAAGLAARLIRRLEVLDPSRYGGDVQNSTFGNIVSSIFGSTIDNTSIEGPPEAVTKARQIAKLAVDVINARALAASGGSRMLVSELNMQKGVIGLEGLTPDSAPAVYQRLADDDVAAMRRFGISYERLQEIKTKLNEKARDYVRSGGLLPSERAARSAAPPASAFQGMEDGQERTFGNGQVWRMEGGTPVRIR